MHTAPQEVTGRPHRGGIDRGLWEHPASEEDGNFLRVNLIVFRLAAVDGFHIQGMPEDKRNAFARTEVGKPIPGEDTLDSNNQPVTRGCNSLEKRFGSCWHVAVQHDLAVLTQDTKVHGAGMQVDAAVKWVLGGVESHEVSSSLERDVSHSQHTIRVC